MSRMKKTIKKLPKSEISIEVSIPEEVFEGYRAEAVKTLGAHVEVAGFRKGKAPADLVEKEIKPFAILEEMAGIAVSEHLPKILVEEKIDAIGRPIINITKIAAGNPLEFTAVVAVLPEVKLPDYKKIAKKTQVDTTDIQVDDAELETAIKELKKAREHNRIHQSGEEHDHAEFEKREFDATLTEEFVKELGAFETIEAFKEKFRENIKTEKIAREKEKGRVATLEAILTETDVELPEILVANEIEQLMARIKGDIAQAGMPFEKYLEHIQKTEEDMRTEIRPDAEKRAKGELVLHKIGEAENLKPNPENIEKELTRLMEVYKDADKDRARAYVTQLLANEEIFKFFESQK